MTSAAPGAQPGGNPSLSPGRRACDQCGGALPGRRRRFCSDLCRRRGHRAERRTENTEYLDVVGRMLRHAARRGSVDLEAFAALGELDAELHDLMATAAHALHARDYTWGEIGRAFGVTRQGARQRWGGDQFDAAP
jgi:hypothetical protein